MSALASDFVGSTITFTDFRINLGEFPRVLIEIYDTQSRQIIKHLGTAKVSRRDVSGYMLNLPPFAGFSTFFDGTPDRPVIRDGMAGIMEKPLTRAYI